MEVVVAVVVVNTFVVDAAVVGVVGGGGVVVVVNVVSDRAVNVAGTGVVSVHVLHSTGHFARTNLPM